MATRAIQLLETIAQADGPVTRKMIRSQLDMTLPTLTRLLAEMVEAGYLARSGRGVYVLGPQYRPMPDESSELRIPEPVRILAPWRDMLTEGIAPGIRRVLEPLRATCVVESLNDPQRDYEQFILDELEKPCSGLLVFDHGRLSSRVVEKAAMADAPLVQIGRPCTGPVDSVDWNAFEVYYAFARALLNAGCDDLHFLASPDSYDVQNRDLYPVSRTRWHGAQAGAADAQVPLRRHLIRQADIENGMANCRLIRALTEARQAGRTSGVIISLYTANVPLITFLPLQGFKLRQHVHVAAIYPRDMMKQFAYYLNQLTARAALPGFEVGEAAAWRVVDRLRGNLAAPQLLLVDAGAEVFQPEARRYEATVF